MRQLQDLQHQLHLQRDKDFWDIQTLFLRNPYTKRSRVSIQSTISVKKKNWMTMIMTTPLVCFTLSFSWAWYRNSSSTKSSSLKTRTVLWISLTNFKDVQWVELSFFPLCGKAMSPDGSCDGSCPIMCILRQAPTCLTWASLLAALQYLVGPPSLWWCPFYLLVFWLRSPQKRVSRLRANCELNFVTPWYWRDGRVACKIFLQSSDLSNLSMRTLHIGWFEELEHH